MYSITNRIANYINHYPVESNHCKITEVVTAVFLTFGVGVATFSAIFFTAHLLVPSMGASLSIVILLGGIDVCILLCKKKNDAQVLIIDDPIDSPPLDNISHGNESRSEEEESSSSSTESSLEIVQAKPKQSVAKVAEQQEIAKPGMHLTIHAVLFDKNILSEVFKFLNEKRICKLTEVCREWKIIIGSVDFLLWKKFEKHENYSFLDSHIMEIVKQAVIWKSILKKQKCVIDKLKEYQSVTGKEYPSSSIPDRHATFFLDKKQYFIYANYLINNAQMNRKVELLKYKTPQYTLNNYFVGKVLTHLSFYGFSSSNDSFVQEPLVPLHSGNTKLFCFKDYFFETASSKCRAIRILDQESFIFSRYGDVEYVYKKYILQTSQNLLYAYDFEENNQVVIEIFPYGQNIDLILKSLFESKISIICKKDNNLSLYFYDIESAQLNLFCHLESNFNLRNAKIKFNDKYIVLFEEPSQSTLTTFYVWNCDNFKPRKLDEAVKIQFSKNFNVVEVVEIFLHVEEYIIDLNTFKASDNEVFSVEMPKKSI